MLEKITPAMSTNYMGEILLNTEKDLGVIVSKSSDWTDQIKSCINKANASIAWVTRSIISGERTLMLQIYKSYVRPNVEYCVQVWSPLPAHGNWGLIFALEDVQ